MLDNLNNQEQALVELREDILSMMFTVMDQLERAKSALVSIDLNLASEIIHIEKRVNAHELSIDKDCENILALYSPVASDLRFILATLSIATQLERIGDHAEGIAKYIITEKINSPYSAEVLEAINYESVFETAITMVKDAIYSFTNEDTSTSKMVFGNGATMNKINKNTTKVLEKLMRETPDQISKYLYLFSIMKKLERIGDLAKNIAEETIFYVDAKYVKHRGKKKSKNK